MSSLDNLEPTLMASKKITEYLKNYSQTQWSRIIKATVILGIQELEKVYGPHGLSSIFAKQIEDMVVKNEESMLKK